MKVLTVGTFDLGHYGHAYLFRWCRRLAGKSGKVVVGVNRDEFVKEFKGKPPILTYRERVELLKAFKDVDEVVPNIGGADSKPLIEKVKPEMIVIGSDWLGKDYCKQMDFTSAWLEQKKIALTYIPRHLPISTTEVKRRVRG